MHVCALVRCVCIICGLFCGNVKGQFGMGHWIVWLGLD